MPKIALPTATIAVFMTSVMLPTAQAAELGVPRLRAPVAASVFSWTGLYVGGHAGYGWANSDWTFDNANFFNPNVGDQIQIQPNGGLGGVQVGFNYQFNSLVVGVEGTWSRANLRRDVVSPFFPTADTESTEVSQIYTVAARFGAAWDRWMVYGKAGWAGVEVQLSAASTFDEIQDAGPTFWRPGRQFQNGWVAGAGVEYALSSNFILGAEYSHIDLGDARFAARNTNGVDIASLTSVTSRTTLDTAVVRLSYKFAGR